MARPDPLHRGPDRARPRRERFADIAPARIPACPCPRARRRARALRREHARCRAGAPPHRDAGNAGAVARRLPDEPRSRPRAVAGLARAADARRLWRRARHRGRALVHRDPASWRGAGARHPRHRARHALGARFHRRQRPRRHRRRHRRRARCTDGCRDDRRAPRPERGGRHRPLSHLRAEARRHERCRPQLHLQHPAGRLAAGRRRPSPALADGSGARPAAERRGAQGERAGYARARSGALIRYRAPSAPGTYRPAAASAP